MICRIEARHYRCLRYIDQTVRKFQVLVGPNASGKTTFLETIVFLGDLVKNGLDDAVGRRSATFQDMVWGHDESGFELAVEALIPEDKAELLGSNEFLVVRYEVALAMDPELNRALIQRERVLLKSNLRVPNGKPEQRTFPSMVAEASSILTSRAPKPARTIIDKLPDGNDHFFWEVTQEGKKRWANPFKLGPRKSALGNLPEDESNFPVSTWLKQLLSDKVQMLMLNSLALRNPSPPGQGLGFRPDGSNIPWVVDRLKSQSPYRFRQWVDHLQTALPDLVDIRAIERQEDKHKYLKLTYAPGFEVPSWLVSDGTLRLLALTLPAYVQELDGVFLIEEPENGIHPRAIESMYQSLSSVYGAQILIATHSPVVLSMVDPQDVLCFAKNTDGSTDIVSGNLHPSLSNWKGETSLGVLFASGVLG